MGRRSSSRTVAGLVAAGSVLVACLGLLPGHAGAAGLLAWLALVAAPLGFVAGALRLPVAASLAVLACVAALIAARPLPASSWPILAWSGLYAAGWGLGGLGEPARVWRGAALLLLAGALLAGLPGRGGLPGSPWPAPAARVLLSLSPATLLAESAGLDWMRHPGVYDSVASDRFERQPLRGALAGPAVLLVGCLLASAALALRGGRSGTAPQERT